MVLRLNVTSLNRVSRMIALLVIAGILSYGCALAVSSSLGGNRHIVEVRGILANASDMYPKWEQKASSVCNGRPYTIVERDYEEGDTGYGILVGTIECN